MSSEVKKFALSSETDYTLFHFGSNDIRWVDRGLERMLQGITRNELRDILYLALPKGFGAETDAYLIRCLDPVSFRIHQAAALGTLTRTFPV